MKTWGWIDAIGVALLWAALIMLACHGCSHPTHPDEEDNYLLYP